LRQNSKLKHTLIASAISSAERAEGLSLSGGASIRSSSYSS
jgi:hypothetical protein